MNYPKYYVITEILVNFIGLTYIRGIEIVFHGSEGQNTSDTTFVSIFHPFHRFRKLSFQNSQTLL